MLFVAGLFVGCIFGMILIGIFAAGKRADDYQECFEKQATTPIFKDEMRES